MMNSNGVGFLAVFAVSGSVVLVAMQLHKRLVEDFMKKVQLELGVERDQPKKKVRFADDVLEPSSNNKEYRQQRCRCARNAGPMESATEIMNGDSVKEMLVTMPIDRLALVQ